MAASSISRARAAATTDAISAGIGTSVLFSSMPFPEKVKAFCSMRSTIPWNVSASPIGSCVGTALRPSRSCADLTAEVKFACSLSIMFTTSNVGVFSWRSVSQTTSVPTSTPALARSSRMAASATRRAL